MRVYFLTLHADNLPEIGKRQHENKGTCAPTRRDRVNRRTTRRETICAAFFSAKRNASAVSGATQHRDSTQVVWAGEIRNVMAPVSGQHQPLRTPENLHSVQRRSGSAAKLSRSAHGVSKEWRRHEAWLIDARESFPQKQEQGVKIHGHQQCPRIKEWALRRSARRLARTMERRSSRFRAPDRRPPSSFVGPRRPALHDRGNGGRHRLRPQYRRDRLCRLPLDVSRPWPGSV